MNVNQGPNVKSVEENSSDECIDAFRYEGERDLGVTIVDRIARHKGVRPDETEGTLHEIIDVDALERLIRADLCASGARQNFHLMFEAFGYEVNIRTGGDVTIRDPSV